MLTVCALLVLQGSVTVRRAGERVLVENGSISLSVDRRDGSYDLAWGTRASASHLFGEVRLPDGLVRKTTSFTTHSVDTGSVRDQFGAGVQVTVHHRAAGLPELRQTFWVYKGRPEVIVRLDVVSGRPVGTNYIVPAATESAIKVAHRDPLQSLFVPYDNDNYFRYRSDGWNEGQGDGAGSFEVGAVYDDGSRNGLIVGSLDHDVWKSAVRFLRSSSGEVASLSAYAGATSKYTHDKEPHGTVTGREIRSPRFVLGCYDDWRAGLERYGDLNALVTPVLPWPGSAPFGWSSWSGHKAKVKAEHAEAATEFVDKQMPWFRDNGTAYLNLDSFWDNLTKVQRREFVERCHQAGLKAGIYYTPFTAWGKLTDRVRGTQYIYSDLAIKDAKGEPLPKLDGGWPLDPTHPGSLARLDAQLDEFIDLGFDYIKFDFMTHASLEGKHFDPAITTGAAAYNIGLKHIASYLSAKKVGRPIFISLSIAPMFPSGYAHSRRTSCDVFANIGATEYLLNSATYGWWTNRRIYRFNDPDSACVYQPMDEPPVSEAESRSRFTASVIVGGMMLLGDDMTKPEARERVLKIYSNRALLEVARKAVSFRPIWGNTGTKAGDSFVWQESGKSVYVAIFNYGKTESLAKSIPLARLGLSGTWKTRELWTNAESEVRDALKLEIAPMDCAIVRLTRP